MSARSSGLRLNSVKGQSCDRRYRAFVSALSKDLEGDTLLRP
jgi:hypothetical protein